MRIAVALVTLLWFAPVAAGAADPTAPPASAPRVRGVVADVSPTALTVTTANGSQTIALSPKTAVLAAEPGSLADVSAGSYLGTTVQPQSDGSLVSQEVHIFPPSMRGTGEGYFPLAGQPGSMMANATVASPAPPSMMANATVRSVSASGAAKTIRLVYAGGAQTVTIPPDAPIVKYVPATTSLLAAGKHVTVIATAPGADLTAARIYVGENGVVPR
jgi:hypothetical protein